MFLRVDNSNAELYGKARRVSEWPEFRIVRAVFDNTKQPWVDHFQLSTAMSTGKHLVKSLVVSQRLKLAEKREGREEKCNQEGDCSQVGRSAFPLEPFQLILMQMLYADVAEKGRYAYGLGLSRRYESRSGVQTSRRVRSEGK